MSKIPNHAKKVFKGRIFDVYQWNQELFDKTFATFEALKRIDTVIVIPVTEEGKVVLIEEEQPHRALRIGPVAGKVDPGETPKQTVERELLEETGLKAKEVKLWYKQEPLTKIEWNVYTYIAKGVKKVAEQSLEGGERITPLFLTFEEFIEKVSEESFPNLSLKIKILEAKLEPQKLEALKKLLFD